MDDSTTESREPGERVKAGQFLIPVSVGLVAGFLLLFGFIGGGSPTEDASAVQSESPFKTRPDFRPPELDVRLTAPGASSGKIFVGSKSGGKAIFRPDGELVWFRPGRVADFRAQRYRGRPVLTWFQAPGPGSGLKRNSLLIADAGYRLFKNLRPGRGYVADSHEFQLTPRGTAYNTIYKPRSRDLRSVGGRRNDKVTDSMVQEIDIRTGRVVWQWRSLEHVPVTDTFVDKRKKPGNPFDYFHINSVADTPDGNILISARGTDAIYKLSRKTGRILWTLGGKRSDFRFGQGARFFQQHDARVVPGGRISLFDNTTSPTVTTRPRMQSRGLVLQLDHRRKTAEVHREFLHPAKPLSEHQANMQRLGNGNFLVGWGAIPIISEHRPSGEMVFDARVKGVPAFYRAYRTPWSGKAPGRPLVVARRAEAGTSVWVSWNGDSRVRNWRVLGGAKSKGLEVLKTAAREGFETRIGIGPDHDWVRVVGLDQSGRSIGSSRTIRVR